MLVRRAERAEHTGWDVLGLVPGMAVAALPWLPEVPGVPKARGVQPRWDRDSLGTCSSG